MEGPRTPLGLKYQLERQHRLFNREEVRQLERDRSGVYALWLPGETDECLYVGMSDTCVRRRLLQHLSNETNPELREQLRLFHDIVDFSAAFTNSEDETLALEDDIIRAWRPQTNRRGLEGTNMEET